MARIELGGEVDNNISLFKRYFISKLKFLNAFKSMANFSITATYTLYTNQTISKCRNASINSKNLARITNTYLTNVSAPRYGLIDNSTKMVRAFCFETCYFFYKEYSFFYFLELMR